MDAGRTLFLRDGYRSTSMDQIAADAAVSKQTVYKQFADKEQLFREIVLGVTGNSDAIIADLTSALRSGEVGTLADLEVVLTDLARRYIDNVLQPHVLALRRLIVAEAERCPHLLRKGSGPRH
jgi:TetR/AcrR family transcriptional repressor of mexJK operon